MEYFPSVYLIRINKLGNERGEIRNPFHLRKLFEFLGLQVATEEEEKIRFGKIILEHKSIFRKNGILYIDGTWHFKSRKQEIFDLKIHGRNLRAFPSATFNKKYGIGYRDGRIESITKLKELFILLGLRVASE